MSRVYVVDDDNAVRNALKLLFRTAQLDVEAFSSADAFLEDADLTQRCCVLLDIRMPGMTGTALHEELRRRSYRVPVIFITGHGDIPMAVDAMRKGAFDFIEKPFDDEQLLSQVRAALESFDAAEAERPSGGRQGRVRPGRQGRVRRAARAALLEAEGGPAARARRQAQPPDRRGARDQRQDGRVPPRAHHAKTRSEDRGRALPPLPRRSLGYAAAAPVAQPPPQRQRVVDRGFVRLGNARTRGPRSERGSRSGRTRRRPRRARRRSTPAPSRW